LRSGIPGARRRVSAKKAAGVGMIIVFDRHNAAAFVKSKREETPGSEAWEFPPAVMVRLIGEWTEGEYLAIGQTNDGLQAMSIPDLDHLIKLAQILKIVFGEVALGIGSAAYAAMGADAKWGTATCAETVH
jgi:hypothetical protein